MIFQLDYATVITFVLVSFLGVSLILFIAGTSIMQMYASKKKWDDSFKIPLKINTIWLIISLAIGIPLSFLIGDNVVIDYIRFGINMLVGYIFTTRYYKKDKGESFQFIIFVQFILFIIAVLFGALFGMIIEIVLLN